MIKKMGHQVSKTYVTFVCVYPSHFSNAGESEL